MLLNLSISFFHSLLSMLVVVFPSLVDLFNLATLKGPERRLNAFTYNRFN